ncbi:MAG: glycine cleavage system transcriptional repressor [Candidatus Sumerlaeota bacterium]|nr:glycine cleavage system transcriptional repressor [Candidatus Sumerlaeota bacterium]
MAPLVGAMFAFGHPISCAGASPMNTHVLLTTVGADRPGIVEDIAGWVATHGGNIEESRMAQLAGEFATIILVAGEGALAERLDDTRVAFEESARLNVFLRTVSARDIAAAAEPQLRYALHATSLDHSGIVHQVAGLLRTHGINVVSAETRRMSAPFSGAPVFVLDMAIDVPSSLPVARLRARLAEFGERENIDVTLTAE